MLIMSNTGSKTGTNAIGNGAVNTNVGVVTANINDDTQEIDLLDLLSEYLAHIPLLAISFIAGALIAGLFTMFCISPKYTATAKLYMVSASSGAAVDLTDLNIGTSLSKDYEVLMQIRPLYEDVIEELGLPYTYNQLLSMVSVSTVSDTRVVSVTTTSTDPDEARDISNSIADLAVTYLPKLMETNAPNIAERAIRPERKSSPSLVKNTVIGAILFLMIALAVITVFYLLDDTLTTAEDVEKEFGIIPLTSIPEGDVKEISDEAEAKIMENKKKKRRAKNADNTKSRKKNR
ncbi:MAG: capsular polysaccharide biosynthesis protein [Lachnospiraceae bacterium]|nr:capsular polysaccharide biosynthesis protein [Lachnospiraceae bacterium]